MTRLLDIKALRERLPLGRTRLYALVRECRHVRIGGRVFLREDDYEDLIRRCTRQGERPSPANEKDRSEGSTNGLSTETETSTDT